MTNPRTKPIYAVCRAVCLQLRKGIEPSTLAISRRKTNLVRTAVTPLPACEGASTMMLPMRPSVAAFDAIAPDFDQRFDGWRSVAAQRRAVRAALLKEFPKSGHILELGGGTGEDAAFLAETGYEVFLTDPSPTMVALAKAKLSPFGGRSEIATGEE